MTAAVQGQGGGGAVDRPSGSGLAEVVDTILDKGLVIDAFVRVSVVGIELLTIDARVVVASVDTYLRFAEAVGRLNLEDSGGKTLPDVLEGAQESGAEKKVKGAAKGALGAAGDTVREFLGHDDEADSTDRRVSGRQRQRRT
jgi:hypothetical protein